VLFLSCAETVVAMPSIRAKKIAVAVDCLNDFMVWISESLMVDLDQ
jgi:hypothetical protein